MSSRCLDLFRHIYVEHVERNLKWIAAVLLVVTISLIIAIVVMKQNDNQFEKQYIVEEHEQICSSPGCIRKAAVILQNMDPSVDPCDDFYNFACGGFLKNTFIPDDQALVNAVASTKTLVYQQIKSMLEEPEDANEIKPFALMRQFYNLCANITAIEDDGLTTINEILNSVGGWPVLEGTDWDENKFDWKRIMYTLRSLGYEPNYFLSIKVIADLRNSSQKVINIDQAELELPREILVEGIANNLVQLYYHYMIDVVQYFGSNGSAVEMELKESLDLEIEIAKICLSSEERRNETLLYNPLTVEKLEIVYPDTDWKEYIKYLLDIPGFQISNSEVIVISVPEYLDNLEVVLNGFSIRSQANYIMWRVVSFSMKYMTRKLSELKTNFNRALVGIRRPLPRWQTCVLETLKRFPEPLRTLYDTKHFSENSKDIVTEISIGVKTEMLNMLKNSDWMDGDTKAKAIEKAFSVRAHDSNFKLHSEEDLTELYSGLNYKHESYLAAVLSTELFTNNRYLADIRKPVEDQESEKYISLEYDMFVPGGIFQQPFFGEDYPYYINYGGIGILIGHLLTHEFDNQGKQLDINAELANWWTEYTENAFSEEAQCFSKGYEDYVSSKLGYLVNGTYSVEETIADVGGIKAAYLAYNTWIENNGRELQLPGLNFTSEQMFWISVANVYCTKYRTQLMHLILLLSQTVLDEYKVKGTFSNLKYFSKDYNCPIGSKMNPEKKCKIW